LIFPIVLIALEVKTQLSYKELAALVIPVGFLFEVGAYAVITRFAHTTLMLGIGLAWIG